MNDMRSSSGIELFGTRTLRLEATIMPTSLPASILNVEVVESNTSFLEVLDNYWYNGLDFNTYNL